MTDDIAGLTALLDQLRGGEVAVAPMPTSLGEPVHEALRRYSYADRCDRVFLNVQHVVTLLNGNHLLTLLSGEVTEAPQGWISIHIE